MNYHNENTCFNEITPEISADNLFAETAMIEIPLNPSTPLPKSPTEPIRMSDGISDDYESHGERMRYH